MGAWAIVMTLSGTFDILTDISIFVLWIFYGMTGAALFVLRRRRPDAERPYRVSGYPVVPALFLLVTAYLLINTLVATPGRALAGLGLVATGLPVYAYYARRPGAAETPEWLGGDPHGDG
jgi:APA family basic amino acid/polyamine antiporter